MKIILNKFSVLFIFLIVFAVGSCTKTPKIYKVGILCGMDAFANTIEGFKSKMNELGYIEGKNIIYEIKKTNSNRIDKEKILSDFFDNKVDLIFTFPSEVTLAAKSHPKREKIPLIFAHAVTDNTGLINSISEPGNNLTGVRYPGPDLAVKRLETLLELAPDVKKVWVGYLKNYPTVSSQLELIHSAAAKFNITIVEVPSNNAEDVITDLSQRRKSNSVGIDAILMIAEPLTAYPEVLKALFKFASDYKLPLGGAFASESGYFPLFGIGPNNIEVGRQCALLAKKILNGVPAGSIPVISAESYLQINLKMAKELGINISDGILKQASEIIQ
ncbi:MAG: ABC transporter substrate-binding protein [bacterium]